MITEIMYADDLCFLAETPDGLQQLMSRFHQACCKFGLKINVKKTEVMSTDMHGHETLSIKLGEDVLQQVDKFCYLGSTITSKCDLDAEINSRIGTAAAVFGKLCSKNRTTHNNKYLSECMFGAALSASGRNVNQERMVSCSTIGVPMEEWWRRYETMELEGTLPEVTTVCTKPTDKPSDNGLLSCEA
ncbi:unnamed protein product, partial [Brenthis ino]